MEDGHNSQQIAEVGFGERIWPLDGCKEALQLILVIVKTANGRKIGSVTRMVKGVDDERVGACSRYAVIDGLRERMQLDIVPGISSIPVAVVVIHGRQIVADSGIPRLINVLEVAGCPTLSNLVVRRQKTKYLGRGAGSISIRRPGEGAHV